MKKFAFVIGLLLIVGCAHSPTTTPPVNIDGLWKGVYRDPQGAMHMTFNFISDGQNTGGFLRNESIQGDWDPIEDLKIKGDKIYFSCSPQLPKGKITIKYKGKIEGDTIRLSYGIKTMVIMGKPPEPSGDQLRSGKGMGVIGAPDSTGGSAYSEEFVITRVKE